MSIVSTDVDVMDEVLEAPIYTRGREAIDAEMDITPMIDCVFLLLIFFIVCSTMDEQSPIDLADARHGKAVGERESVIITVGEGGVDSAPVYLSDSPTGEALPADPDEQRERIITFIEQQRLEEEKNDILIKADRNVAHRDVAQVIKAASQVEGVNIHLAVTESD